MPNIDENRNFGVLPDEVLETDLFLGSNDRVAHTINLPNRMWLKYYSNGELQIGTYFDTMGCVSFSANKVLEAVLNYLIEHKMLSEENVQWLKDKGYIGADGKVNLSDRFTTAMSGTSPRGNTGGRVWWSMRNKGVVPEAMCPWDRGRDVDMDERYGNWYRDPDNVSAEAKALGLEFVKRFEIFYERTATTKEGLFAGLLHSPVQVFIPTRCPYKDTIQQACDAGITHAVSAVDDTDPRNYYPLFDHYIKQRQEEGQERFIRRVVKDYPFYRNGYVCTVAEKNIIPKQPEHMAKLLRNPENGGIYAIFADNTKQHIKTMDRVRKGQEKGLWGEWTNVTQEELDKYENTPNEVAFLV